MGVPKGCRLAGSIYYSFLPAEQEEYMALAVYLLFGIIFFGTRFVFNAAITKWNIHGYPAFVLKVLPVILGLSLGNVFLNGIKGGASTQFIGQIFVIIIADFIMVLFVSPFYFMFKFLRKFKKQQNA